MSPVSPRSPIGHRTIRSVLTRLRGHVLVVLALGLVLSSTAFAVDATSSKKPKKTTTYYACVTERYQTLNLTTKNGRCPGKQRKITLAAKSQRGATGKRGPAGTTGSVGPVGPAGAPGVGIPGREGAPGAVGPTGHAGVAGPAGPKGDAGDVGPAGPEGPKGDAGDVGPTGPEGPKGDAGDVGPTGPEGPKGDAGDVGPTGPEGPKGDAGDVGPTGPAGAPGATFERIAAGEQLSVTIPDLGSFYLGCGPGGVAADRYIVTVYNSSGETASVWIDDSIGGMSFREIATGVNHSVLNNESGTRRMTVRMMTDTKSGTWGVFIEGSDEHGCRASVQHTS